LKPVVSVVVPTYNRARDLERAIDSVLAQTHAAWELLVVDNHSSDDTDAVLHRYADPRISLLKIHNQGVIAASRNVGIANAKGEFIAFLDSDDWWKPRKLEQSLRYLEAGADVVYHDMRIATRPGQRLFWRRDRSRDIASPAFTDLLMNSNALKTSSVVARKNILHAVGGMSEDAALITMEDFDTWLRIAQVRGRFRRIPHALGYYWAGGGNATNPVRSLTALDQFEKKYDDSLRALDSGRGIWWIRYMRLRALYKLGDKPQAARLLADTGWDRAPLPVRIKVLTMALVLCGKAARSRLAKGNASHE
jgi:glycosyltransferase involved in cell wall biosynthesis